MSAIPLTSVIVCLDSHQDHSRRSDNVARQSVPELIPFMDMFETGKKVYVKFDLPGVDSKAIDVRLNGDILTVSAERPETMKRKQPIYHHLERQASIYHRSTVFPCPIRPDTANARFQNGVLSISVKMTKGNVRRNISVKS